MATATVPAAVAAPPAPDPAGQTGSALPASTGVIHVTPASIEAGAEPKAGSARESMFKELRKRAKPMEDQSSATAEPAKPAKPEKPQKTEQKPQTEEEASREIPTETKTGDETTAQAETPGEKKKVSPWKLVDEYKKRAAEAEAKIAEFTKGMPSEEARAKFKEEMQKREQRLKELEDEIRYVNYAKSEEFKKTYQEPYEKAWTRAMSELKEITITDPNTNQVREIQPTDLLELVNLPLGRAREVATQLFGDFADDVMTHRKEIRNLFEAQNAALEEAKTKGSEREKERMQRFMQYQQEVTKIVGETWAKANEVAAKDEKYGKFFTPAEGDEEGNKRLEKGFELVDKAFAENPFAPNLKPEDRAAIVKRHAAVRNRAAAFGRLVLQLSQKDEKIKELEGKLKAFESSTPPTGGGSAPAGGQAGPASAKDSVFQALRKIAK